MCLQWYRRHIFYLDKSLTFTIIKHHTKQNKFTMKKTILLFVLGTFMSLSLTAQKSFYLQFNTGYGFQGLKDDLGSPFSEVGSLDFTLNADSSLLAKIPQGTLGDGFKAELGAGYMFNPNFGVELLLGYVSSPTTALADYQSAGYTALHEVQSYRVVTEPQLVFRAGTGKLQPFVKAGLVIPLFGISNTTVNIVDKEGRLLVETIEDALGGIELPPGIDLSQLGVTAQVAIEATSKSKFTIGFQSSLGLSYQLGEKIILNGAFFYEVLSLPIASSEIQQYDIDVDLGGLTLPIPIPIPDFETLDTIDKETTYVNSLTENSNNPLYNSNPDVTQPLEDLSFKNNYNSMGVEVGISFMF